MIGASMILQRLSAECLNVRRDVQDGERRHDECEYRDHLPMSFNAHNKSNQPVTGLFHLSDRARPEFRDANGINVHFVSLPGLTTDAAGEDTRRKRTATASCPFVTPTNYGDSFRSSAGRPRCNPDNGWCFAWRAILQNKTEPGEHRSEHQSDRQADNRSQVTLPNKNNLTAAGSKFSIPLMSEPSQADVSATPALIRPARLAGVAIDSNSMRS
jgi:hypothetical protein